MVLNSIEIHQQDVSHLAAANDMRGSHVNDALPMDLWNERREIYRLGWEWYSGAALAEVKGKTKDGQDVLRYPLQISPRNIFRKHVSFLFGETPDTPTPLVRTVVVPIPDLDAPGMDIYPTADSSNIDSKRNTEVQQLASFSQNVMNQIWLQSNGRALQQENGMLSQYMGGSVFQLKYFWDRKDLLVPISLRRILPQNFFPIWSEDNDFEILECYVSYRIPGATARRQYGLDTTKQWVNYVEYWNKEIYSIYIDSYPLKEKGITYDKRKNPFGIVPFVYIPHLREGQFYGPTHIEDIGGLLKEFNARFADLGMGIKTNIDRTRFIKNVTTDPIKRPMPDGKAAIDLGGGIPGGAEPEIDWEVPPEYPVAFTQYLDKLWAQLLREGHLNSVAYGEDEGSQRSALTLAFRMWPSTAHARQERTFWTEGINRIWYIAMHMLAVKGWKSPGGQKVPIDFMKKIQPYPDWQPQIPRDRESQLNEVVLRKQSGLMSVRKALVDLGDTSDVDRELEEIHQDKLFEAELGTLGAADEGAPQDLNEPIANTGVGDE